MTLAEILDSLYNNVEKGRSWGVNSWKNGVPVNVSLTVKIGNQYLHGKHV